MSITGKTTHPYNTTVTDGLRPQRNVLMYIHALIQQGKNKLMEELSYIVGNWPHLPFIECFIFEMYMYHD